MFRKPKKIQRRVFCADEDDDGEPEPPPPPIISQNKKEKPVKSTPTLSFADEGKILEDKLLPDVYHQKLLILMPKVTKCSIKDLL